MYPFRSTGSTPNVNLWGTGQQAASVLPSGALRITTGVLPPNVLSAAVANSAWMAMRYRVGNGFQASFSWNATKAGGYPQGFAFVIQNAAANALGSAGMGLGYATINNSFALEFDMFPNGGGDSSQQHMELHTAYASPNTAESSTRMAYNEAPGE